MAKAKRAKTTTKQQADKLLARVPEEYVFYSRDGRVLKDMRELGEALVMMSDETFAYHCNPEKNDFSSWVRDIIKDEQLAQDLSKAPDRASAAKIVNDRVTWLAGKLGP